MLTFSRCYNCGGLDHHAKECSLPPQPKKCHYCQSIAHMVAHCPHKTLTPPPPSSSSQGRLGPDPQASTSASGLPPYPQESGDGHGRSSQEVSPNSKASVSPEDPARKGPSVQKRKKT